MIKSLLSMIIMIKHLIDFPDESYMTYAYTRLDRWVYS